MQEAKVDAQTVFDYLAVCDPLPERADCVVGFGHFDPAIALRCCELFHEGRAPLIAFCGGHGAGSADLGCPEAQFFFTVAREHYPNIPESAFVLEINSTNTGENVQLLAELLACRIPPLRFGQELRTVLLVASPYRQRRVWLTCRHRLRGVSLYNAPPVSTFEEQCQLFASKGQNLHKLMVGEVERIMEYPRAGFILAEKVPESVLQAYRVLREAQKPDCGPTGKSLITI